MRRVLVLNGSPTPNGNTTALVNEFVKGVKEGDNIVNICNIREMNIHPCIGCMGGGKDKNSPCTQKDDMDIIYKYYKNADVIVFASPLYWWSYTAQLKMVIDRLFAVMEGPSIDGAPAYQFDLTPRVLMTIVPAEEDTTANFQLIDDYFEGYIQRMGWTSGGKLFVGGVLGHNEIQDKPEALQQAYMMGKSIK